MTSDTEKPEVLEKKNVYFEVEKKCQSIETLVYDLMKLKSGMKISSLHFKNSE